MLQLSISQTTAVGVGGVRGIIAVAYSTTWNAGENTAGVFPALAGVL